MDRGITGEGVENMSINWKTFMITGIVVLSLISLITGNAQWGILGGLLVGVGGAKWLRLRRKEDKGEIEYDERVNENIKRLSFETFSFSNLFLLVYILFSMLVLEEPKIDIKYLILYLCITFVAAYYIVPFIARRK